MSVEFADSYSVSLKKIVATMLEISSEIKFNALRILLAFGQFKMGTILWQLALKRDFD